MHDRLQTFIRRYKRKGGENGGPGSIEDLKSALKNCGLEEIEDIDETLGEFLDGGSYGIWENVLKYPYMELEDDNKLKFMNELNRVKWIPTEE